MLSHPQAISQCARFLRERVPQAAVAHASSTAEATRIVVAQDEPWAAIGTLPGGRAVRRDGARRGRRGRARKRDALRLARAARGGAGARRRRAGEDVAVVLGIGRRQPGWLVRCLSEFAFRGVNLTKIESRPLRLRLGHYRFFVDCEGSTNTAAVAEAVDGLRKHCEQVRILGSYPAAGPPD